MGGCLLVSKTIARCMSITCCGFGGILNFTITCSWQLAQPLLSEPVMLVIHALSEVFRNLLAVTVSVFEPAGNRDFSMADACSTDMPRWMPSISGSLDGSRPAAGGTGAWARIKLPRGPTNTADTKINARKSPVM